MAQPGDNSRVHRDSAVPACLPAGCQTTSLSERHVSGTPAESGQWAFWFRKGFGIKRLRQKPPWQHEREAGASIQVQRVSLSPSSLAGEEAVLKTHRPRCPAPPPACSCNVTGAFPGVGSCTGLSLVKPILPHFALLRRPWKSIPRAAEALQASLPALARTGCPGTGTIRAREPKPNVC